ncbi:MAG: MsnO8 family LLM class oxidoreductase [Micrococcus sp.]|nr:MsnO8 family LLM class oxidoreductase [Micrococcus sp.]
MTSRARSRLPVSILDRANALAGFTEAEALSAVVDRAQRAELLGFTRFWVAEHHGVPGIAGSTPTVLMADLAARTQTIRIGSGGVMLPNHQPLVVAEQAATLEALFPGRIDLGLGRSLGFTPAVRRALRTEKDAAQRFAEDLAELIGFLRGNASFTARPRDDAATPLFVLATGQGLATAARAGLAVVVGGPSLFQREGHATHPGLDRYRERFRPSPWYAQPYVIASATVAVADSREAARRLLLPEAWALARSRSQGEFRALADVDDVVARLHGEGVIGRDRQRVRENLERTVHGTPGQVRAGVEDLIDFTGADELLVTGGMSDLEGQRRSDELVAELFASAPRR